MYHKLTFFTVVIGSIFMAFFYPISSMLSGGLGLFGQLGAPFIFITLLAVASAGFYGEQANRIAKLEKRLADLERNGGSFQV